MLTQPPPSNEFRQHYESESARLLHEFSANRDGLQYLHGRSELVSGVVHRVWEQLAASPGLQSAPIVLAAVGDLGRETFFPYSECELVFLAASVEVAEKFRAPVERLTQLLIEIGIKSSITSGISPEFIRFDSDHADAMLALLDFRFLEGDAELFSSLRDRLIPGVMAQESQALVERIAELTRNSHRKFANTVFHLEPNAKEGPGGFRDYVTARWLAAISAIVEHGGWPDPKTYFAAGTQTAMDSALR